MPFSPTKKGYLTTFSIRSFHFVIFKKQRVYSLIQQPLFHVVMDLSHVYIRRLLSLSNFRATHFFFLPDLNSINVVDVNDRCNNPHLDSVAERPESQN